MDVVARMNEFQNYRLMILNLSYLIARKTPMISDWQMLYTTHMVALIFFISDYFIEFKIRITIIFDKRSQSNLSIKKSYQLLCLAKHSPTALILWDNCGSTLYRASQFVIWREKLLSIDNKTSTWTAILLLH